MLVCKYIVIGIIVCSILEDKNGFYICISFSGVASLYAISLAIAAWVLDPFGPNFQIRHTRMYVIVKQFATTLNTISAKYDNIIITN